MMMGLVMIFLGLTMVFSGASLMVRDYCHQFLVAPKEGLQFVNIKMNGTYAEIKDGNKLEEIQNPIYRFVLAGKNKEGFIFKEEDMSPPPYQGKEA